MAGPDFYTILGLSRTATPDEIKSAHRELVKKYHPDLFSRATQKAQANKKLQQINEAYAVLSNPERRRQYDARHFQRETVVKPREAASKQRCTTSFRRPPTKPAWEKIARQADEKRQQLTKTFRDLGHAAFYYYSDFLQKARIAKQAAATQNASGSVHSGVAAARVWNLVRPWTRWVSIKVTAVILGIMVLVLILRGCVGAAGDCRRMDIAAKHSCRPSTR